MSKVHHVKLELLRPGPSHNQLLSPLTPYIALCGETGPVTVQLPFEHRQLLSRLQRLRYSTASGEIPVEQREFEARDMGEVLGKVLSQVPSLANEISKAGRDDQTLIHLRISVSALELAIVPFELAIAPEGLPESGLPLFLQSNLPISVTREVRRGHAPRVDWNRKPRILYAFAQPAKVAPIPAVQHLNALRRAIEYWVKWHPDEQGRLKELKKTLTVLPNASLEAIRDECMNTEFTHVHILAHGAELDSDEQRFGIVLCDAVDPSRAKPVDGETLAHALTGACRFHGSRRTPTLVSLTTCDSGQVGSVVAPGGSIAHVLNNAGIPWVVASQFPLWMRPSTVAVDVLYSGLLQGEDPRCVLHKLRKQLRTDSAATHDWASIVAYATMDSDFDHQLKAFRNYCTRSKLEVWFDRAEKLVLESDEMQNRTGQLDKLYNDIRQELQSWCAEPASAVERSERLGMWAASEKRIGLLHAKAGKSADAQVIEAYVKARELYRKAFEGNPGNHWVITQYLCMSAVLGEPEEDEKLAGELGNTWITTRQIALWDLHGATGENKAWALGTLAELELLGAVYAGEGFDKDKASTNVESLCRQICESVEDNAFPVFSTRRQFERYRDYWPREVWREIAEAAINILPDEKSWKGRPYVPDMK
jgi:hypothetical protein